MTINNAEIYSRLLRYLSTACLLATYVLLGACSQGNSPTSRGDKPPQQVLTEPVLWQQRETVIEAVGTSRAQQTATLYPQVSDEVTAVLFKAGDQVEKNQPLLQLDDRDERLAVELAKVQVADAQQLYQRYINSKGAGAVTDSTLDTAKSELEQAQIRLQRAQVVLSDHTIVAPFTGVMGLTDIDPGARVTPSTAIATIDDRSTLLVSFEVPEVFLGQLSQEQEITLSTWSANGPKYRGVIHSIASQIDAMARTFAVRATVDNSDDQLRPGMSFRVRLILSDGSYPTVPEIALQWGGDGAFVWTLDEGKAKRVSATVVQRIKGKVIVDAKLEQGSRVITEGTHRVREGQRIEVLEREAAGQ